jgi:glycosyltransferase involved in cell wall biosynthesis
MLTDSKPPKREGGRRFSGTEKKSAPGLPLITVITATLDAAKTISITIQSVRLQSYPNIEWIVIDGGSKDGTVEILKDNEDTIDYWASELDSGIYEALNKGIENAHGDWMLFLGADDRLAKEDIVATIFARRPVVDEVLIYGDVQYENAVKPVLSDISIKTLLHNTLHHQGAFYSRKLFDAGWRYDEGFELFADYELNLRIALERYKVVKLDKVVVSICSDNGRSRRNPGLLLRETNEIRRKYCGYFTNELLSVLFALKVYAYRVRHK